MGNSLKQDLEDLEKQRGQQLDPVLKNCLLDKGKGGDKDAKLKIKTAFTDLKQAGLCWQNSRAAARAAAMRGSDAQEARRKYDELVSAREKLRKKMCKKWPRYHPHIECGTFGEGSWRSFPEKQYEEQWTKLLLVNPPPVAPTEAAVREAKEALNAVTGPAKVAFLEGECHYKEKLETLKSLTQTCPGSSATLKKGSPEEHTP